MLFSVTTPREWIHAIRTDKMFRVPFLTQSVNTSTHNSSFASSTNWSSWSVVMLFTIWLSIFLKIRKTIERSSTITTAKTLWVPLLAQSIDQLTRSHISTSSAFWAKSSLEARLAIRHSRFFKEWTRSEWLTTGITNKAIHMPFLIQSINTSISNSLITESTSRAEHILITSFAIWFSICFIETTCSKRLLAGRTNKVIRVIYSSHCLNAFSINVFLAEMANTFRGFNIFNIIHLVAEGSK